MKRRAVLQLGCAVLLVPRLASSQTAKLHRVGFVATTSPLAEMSGPNPANPFVRAFVHGLRDLGYVQGRNLALELRTLDGKFEALDGVIAELVRLKTEVVFVPSGIYAVRAQKIAPHLPIVALFAPSSLIKAGVVQSAGRPGGTVTGVSIDVDEQLEAKRLELLKELAPRSTRIAYVGLRIEWESGPLLKMRATAERLGMSVVHVDVAEGDFAGAFARLPAEANAIMVERSPRAYGRRQEIGRLAAGSGLPTSCHSTELVEEGCLMSYSPDNIDWGRRVAVYVDKILKGTKPGDLPIEAPTKFELIINARAAKALGIAIPQSILLRADRVIE